MGATCARPDDQVVEYFGPTEGPRTQVPNDLSLWKKALAEKERMKPKQSSGTSNSVPKQQVGAGAGLLTPDGTKIGKIKEDSAPEESLALI